MKIAVFSFHGFEKNALLSANETYGHELSLIESSLSQANAILANGHDCVSAFTTDKLDAACLTILKTQGVKLIALRSAGFNHVDLSCAKELGLKVVRVPKYSPYAVAEYSLAMMLTLNRKTHRAYNRVRELNFSLEGLVGFDMHGKTVGVVGTGKIGAVLIAILHGFGCRILAFDAEVDEDLVGRFHVEYVSKDVLLANSDIVSLHVPLSPATHHFIDASALRVMKDGAMLINTGRGALVDAAALIEALKSGQLGAAGLDVYEEEEAVFFHDHSQEILQDEVLARLLTFPNVFVSSHQGFLTREAIRSIAQTTLESASDYEKDWPLRHLVP